MNILSRRRFLPFYGVLWLLLLAVSVGAHAAAPTVQIQVQGVSGDMLKNVLAYLSINAYKDAPNLNDALVEQMNSRAPNEIQTALQPFGYYQARVASDLKETESGWSVTYTVTPGTPVKLRQVDVSISGPGQSDAALTQYLAGLPLKAGAQLNQPLYEQVKQRLLDIAAHRGYLDAKYQTSVLRVDPSEHWADVELHLDTGVRYYFGSATFVQDFMNPKFLAQYVTFKPGDPYDSGKLLGLEYALNDSGYFDNVQVQPQRNAMDSERRIPIVITLSPRKRNKYVVGLGYGTDTGPRMTLGWENRRLNGEGHKLSVLGQYSHVLASTQVGYTVPTPNGPTLVYSLANVRQILGSGVAYTTALGVNRFTNLNAWSWNQYLQLSHNRSDYVASPSSISTLLLPGSTFSRVVTDDPVFPTHGYRLSLDIRGASQALGSSTSFLRADLSAKLIVSIAPNTRLLLRGEVGATATNNFAALPLAQRFFTGGDMTVRGFAFNSIGPTDQFGNVIGGKDLMVGSVEVDHMLGPVFGVAAFVDAGNVFNSFNTSLEKGVGVGLRWRTPVGMVRVDFAHPVKRPDLDRVRIHISIGADL
ncbi:MAG TPA: autotransporter assembly complex family protein [Gammaproteobacteria bacterium]|nr:autotransporter assembly complex family protein [Gammaproteobacteria bacterium]